MSHTTQIRTVPHGPRYDQAAPANKGGHGWWHGAALGPGDRDGCSPPTRHGDRVPGQRSDDEGRLHREGQALHAARLQGKKSNLPTLY